MEFQECLRLCVRRDLAWGSSGRGMEHDLLRSPGGASRACRAAAPGRAFSLGPCCPLSSADLSQVEITHAYLAKEADEISLQQADVVLVLDGEDGKCQRVGAAAGEGFP